LAYIVPSDITQLALSGAHELELETLAALKKELSADYTVFHGVHWSRSRRGYTMFGEIDFVVVNRSGGVLLIEQKNGALEEGKDGLTKKYRDGAAKNPGDQVRRSLEKVRDKFSNIHGSARGLEIDYLVYCPDHKLKHINAAALDRERIVDASEKDKLAKRINQILGLGKADNEAWLERVEGFFRQTFEIVPDIHAFISAQEKSFTRLSGGLSDVLGNIEMAPLRLRVQGTAGCGKSQVARYFYEAAIADGQRPLLVCYTRPLKERLGALLDGGGKVQTWNGICNEFLSKKGHKLDYEQMNKDPDFWRKTADLVIGEDVPDNWKFDLLIVDEGQDFEQDWLDILALFQKDERNVVWLEDADQNVFNKKPVRLDGFVGYRSRENYRSPESIARFISKNLPFQFECANLLPGMGVGMLRYKNPEEQADLVGKAVSNLLTRGFSHDDIAVLTCRGVGSSTFSNLDKVGPHTLARFTGTYDKDGNQIWTKGKLRFESVYRFKGQQAPAIVLVDVDPSKEEVRLERDQRVLFCGMTRATVRLELVMKEDNPLNRKMSN
jgi:hypothetical protein